MEEDSTEIITKLSPAISYPKPFSKYMIITSLVTKAKTTLTTELPNTSIGLE